MKKIIDLFNKIQSLGINSSDSELEKKHITITNIFLSSYAFVLFLYVPFILYYVSDTGYTFLFLLFSLFLFCYGLVLTSKRRFTVAKVLGVFTGISLMFINFLLYGNDINMSLYLIAVLPFPYVMFNKGEKKLLVLTVIYGTICYLCMQINPFHFKPLLDVSEDFIIQFSVINIVLPIISTLTVSLFNFSAIYFIENSLIEANRIALEQKKVTESHQKRITQSINYSKNIQTAIFPSKEDLDRSFKDNFILHIPKNIISGDFPWLQERDGYTYVAIVDCTGHGVPGAMLSITGNLLLNKIVKGGNQLKMPSEILDQLHVLVVDTLKQRFTNNNMSDGMEIALCRISPDRKELVFAGARRPLYLLKDNVLERFKGDQYPIGGIGYTERTSYNDQIIPIKEGNSIYICSDGFQNQFGGDSGVKIGRIRLRGLLEKQSGQNMSYNKESITNYFINWKGKEQQIDDLLMIGINF